MSWKAQIDDRGVITRYKESDTDEVVQRQRIRTTQCRMQSSIETSQTPGISAGSNGGGYEIAGSCPVAQMAYPQESSLDPSASWSTWSVQLIRACL